LGRKVHPIGFRLGIVKDHAAHWYAEGREYAELLGEDRAIRSLVRAENARAGISRIEIERLPVARQVSIKVHTAKPGILIGRKGQNVTVLRKKLEKFTGKKIHLDIIWAVLIWPAGKQPEKAVFPGIPLEPILITLTLKP